MSDQHSTIVGASSTTATITGIAAILAPILLLASTLAYVVDGNGINDGTSGGAIGVWSCFAFLLALIGIHRMLEPSAPRSGPIWLTVCVIGAAAGVGFNIDGLLAAEFGRDAVDAVTEESVLSTLAYLPWGLLFPLGLIGTGVLMWRTRTFPKATAALVAAGGVLFVASRPSRVDAAAVLADCVLVLAFVPIGWRLLVRRPTSTTAGVAEATTPAPVAGS